MDRSQQEREKIITLHSYGNLSGREIAKRLNMPQRTVSDIIRRFKESGASKTNRKGRCGRPRLTSSYDDRIILRASIKDPKLTAVDINKDIQLGLSVHTVRRRLLEGGRLPIKPPCKPLLTDRIKRLRFKWAKEHQEWTMEQWRNVSIILIPTENLILQVDNNPLYRPR